MYTLKQAKDEIDTVARHATDIAHHVLTLSDDLDAKLERLKTEILGAIESRFAELHRSIQGDGDTPESSALGDLGAKVSQLLRPASSPQGEERGGEREEARSEGDPEWSPSAQSDEPRREEQHGGDLQQGDRPHDDEPRGDQHQGDQRWAGDHGEHHHHHG